MVYGGHWLMIVRVDMMSLCGSDGSLVGDVLVDVVHVVLVLASVVLAATHEVEKAGDVDVDFLLVGKPALGVLELTLSQGVVDAGLIAEVMGKATLVTLGAVVIVVELSADILCWLGSDDLPLDGVREEAVEAVLAVAHVEVNAGVVASVDVDLSTLRILLPVLALALADCKVLVGAKILDLLQLSFQPLVLQKLLVVHLLNYINIPSISRSIIRRTLATPTQHPKPSKKSPPLILQELQQI